MFYWTRLTVVVLLLVAAQAAPAQEKGEVILHVDLHDTTAADTNGGAAQAPLRTIAEAGRRALANRHAGKSTKILIHPGVYREAIELGDDPAGDAAPAIVFEGAKAGAVIISGADIWGDWVREGTGDLYQHPWPYAWGLASIPRGWDSVEDKLMKHPVVLRGEMVFVDGKMLRQVMSRDEVQVTTAAFCVEEGPAKSKSGTLWVHAPAGTDLHKAKVEVAVRPMLFVSQSVGNLVLRNLSFTAASTQLQAPAVLLDGCAHVLVEDCQINWNNWNGLHIATGRDITLRRIAANHNGAGGVGCWRAKGLVLEDCEASYNNWRGLWGKFTGWATGQKFFSVHGGRFVRYKAVGNHAVGLWFDTDNADVVVENASLCNNDTSGMFLEASQGPITIRDSRICGNSEHGILVTQTSRVLLEHNTIADNKTQQIFIPWLADTHAVRTETNYETGEPMNLRVTHWKLSNNTIAGSGKTLLFSVGKWDWFLSTFESDGNHWHHQSRADCFALYNESHAAPATTDLAGWRQWTMQEAHSSFDQSAIPCDADSR